MPSFAGARIAAALALAALTGLAGCSRRPEQPLDTGAAEHRTPGTATERAPTSSAPDTHNLGSIHPDGDVPVPEAREDSRETSPPPPPRGTRSETSPEPAPPPPSPPPPLPEPDSQLAARPGSGSAALLGRAEGDTAPRPTDLGPAAARALPAGTTIRATLRDSINSREQSPGDVVAASVRQPVRDRNGRVVLAAGTRVELSIAEIEPAKAAEPEDARLVLRADSILIDGRTHPVRAEVEAVPYQLEGRGVTGKEAGKVGIGAAAGAVLGRVLSGETEGAVVGGAVGAAGGAAVAARRARKDVVVKPGTPLVLTLREPLVLTE